MTARIPSEDGTVAHVVTIKAYPRCQSLPTWWWFLVIFHWLMVDIWTSLGSSKLLKRDHSIHYWNSYKPLEPVRIQIRAMLLIWNRDFELLPAETFQKRPGHSSNIRLLQTDFWCELQVQNHATVPLEGRVTWCWRECGSLKLTFF